MRDGLQQVRYRQQQVRNGQQPVRALKHCCHRLLLVPEAVE